MAQESSTSSSSSGRSGFSGDQRTIKGNIVKAVAFVNVFSGAALDTLAQKIDAATYNKAFENAEGSYETLSLKFERIKSDAQDSLRRLWSERGGGERG